MIAAGVLDNPRVDAAFGIHMAQDLPGGTIGICPGPMAAAPDSFNARICGLGGHAAAPHHSIDPVVVAAHCIVALQTLVSREVNPLRQAVITVGVLHAGTVRNIIPQEATLEATVRTFDPAIRRDLAARIPALITGIAAAMRATAEIDYELGYPALVNDAALSDLARDAVTDLLGPDHVVASEPGMFGEDMAYFLQRVPGCFFVVGSNNPARGLIHAHHHPRFDIDDEIALPTGVAALTTVALRYLNN